MGKIWAKIMQPYIQFGPIISNLGQFEPKLCNLISQAIMSQGMLSKIFEMLSYDGIQYLDQSNNGQFTQKILFQANTIDLVLA